MDYNQRKGVIEKLGFLEENFPVEKWKLNGIHVWPILKVKLFFETFNQGGKNKTSIKKVTFFQKINHLLAEIPKLKLKNADFIFSGSHTHRVWFEDEFINRYFDPLIDYLNNKNIPSVGLEYNSLENLSGNYIKIDKLIPLFMFPTLEPEEILLDQDFQLFLDELADFFSIEKPKIVSLLLNSVKEVIKWKKQYLFIFKKVQPKYCFGLCYYSIPMMGMNAAAKEMGIVSVDMQHGTQGKLHAAYTFGKVPEEGYNVLPKEFWCWDEESYEQILSWTKDSFHQVKLSGNPWFEFLLLNAKEASQTLPQDKPLILYTHQPLKPVLEEYFIEAIKRSKQDYNWWLRLHPTITDKDRNELLDLLHENGLLNNVEIEKAGFLPLPVLLQGSALHISKYSGSLIEAALVGTPSLILEEIGVKTFGNLIHSGKAIGLLKPTTDALLNGIEEALNIKITSPGEEVSYKFILDKILKCNLKIYEQ